MYEPWHSTRSDETARLLRGHCQHFSRLGWALFAQMLSMLLAQAGILLIVGVCAPGLTGNSLFLWLLCVLSVYGISVPVFCLVIRPAPAAPGPVRGAPLGPVRFFQTYCMSLAALYLANYATLALLWVVGQLRGAPVSNPVESIQNYPAALNLLLGCVIAPAAEELMFRRLLLDRLRPYGDRFAVFASALCFGLFHGNLNQMFYAFALGVIFAYVMLRTGRLWQTVLLHALVNAVSVALAPLLARVGAWGDAALGVFVLTAIVLGVTFFLARRRELSFAPGGSGFPEARKWRLFFENPGMICFCLLAGLLTAAYLTLE